MFKVCQYKQNKLVTEADGNLEGGVGKEAALELKQVRFTLMCIADAAVPDGEEMSQPEYCNEMGQVIYDAVENGIKSIT